MLVVSHLIVAQDPHVFIQASPHWLHLCTIHVLTYWHTLAAGAHVSDDVVYNVAKTMHEKRGALVKAFPGWGGFKSDKMAIRFKSLTYHPGAIRFYKEKDMWPPK